jgi:hypothetical protein
MTDFFRGESTTFPPSPAYRHRPLVGKLGLAVAIAIACVTSGCTFYARSPDKYRDDTSSLLATKSAELNTCYDNAAKATPGISGKVTVKFTVEKKTGKILNVTADPTRTTAPQPLIDCVVSSINGLVLAPPDQRDGDATFEYDFARANLPPQT